MFTSCVQKVRDVSSLSGSSMGLCDLRVHLRLFLCVSSFGSLSSPLASSSATLLSPICRAPKIVPSGRNMLSKVQTAKARYPKRKFRNDACEILANLLDQLLCRLLKNFPTLTASAKPFDISSVPMTSLSNTTTKKKDRRERSSVCMVLSVYVCAFW